MRTLAFAAMTRALPPLLMRRFDRERAGDLDAEFELRVRGAGEARFGVRVREGACVITQQGAVAPGAVVEIGARDLIELATGRAAWPQLLSARRLAFSGDPFLALRFPVLFQLVRNAATPRP